MSKEYKVIVAGREDFTLPFALLGIETLDVSSQGTFLESLDEIGIEGKIYILEEGIIENPAEIESLEMEKGANILVLNSWGYSALAESKIRAASIKAIGIDLSSEEKSEPEFK